jgi:hypothetical protein
MKIDFSKCRNQKDVEKVLENNKNGLHLQKDIMTQLIELLIELNGGKRSTGDPTETHFSEGDHENIQ